MTKQMTKIAMILVLAIGLTAGAVTAQIIVVEETRPFDFSDKFYVLNGVEPNLIFDRVTGEDKYSVRSKTWDENHRDVRIIATLPAYNYDGSILYFNLYGKLNDKGFVDDETGNIASDTAKTFPMFVFPSTTVKGEDRQANLIEAGAAYFEKNPLGLSILIEVDFTAEGQSSDSVILAEMAKRNGTSLDGTPIIKTIDEIYDLTRMGLVTQRVKGIDTGEPSFAIAKVLDISKPGVIAPDALLMIVTNSGNPLKAETFFVENFDCLKKDGKLCAEK